MRTTTIRDDNGTVHVIQNGKIDTLANQTKGWSAITMNISVAYKEDTDRVSRLMQEAATPPVAITEYKEAPENEGNNKL